MIEGYLNDDGQSFFAELSPEQQAWTWSVLEILRTRYPKWDHWTTGGRNFNYTDIRIGRRALTSQRAKVVIFRVCRDASGPALIPSQKLQAEGPTQLMITHATHASVEEVRNWIDEHAYLVESHFNEMLGDSLMPSSYASSEREVDETEPARPRDPAQSAGRSTQAINTILFGPPGTGKTHATVDEALHILDPVFMQAHTGNREQLKARFDELAHAGRVRFVTFHQSLSYEDFVEGLRAVSEPEEEGGSGAPSYRVEHGVFRQLCEAARRDTRVDEGLGVREGARLWKLSLDGTGQSTTRDYCYAKGEARIGWGHVGDLLSADLAKPEFGLGSNDRHSLTCFAKEVETGDVILSIRSNREVGAVGVVTGGYRFEPTSPSSVRTDYSHVLPVRWLATDLSLDLRVLNAGKQFTLKTFYPLQRLNWTTVLEALTTSPD